MRLTISRKLYGLGLLGLVFTLATGITGAWGIGRVATGIGDVSSISSVIRDHIQASVFLDWSRTDVSKMLTTSGDAQSSALSELQNHEKLLQDKLSQAQSSAKGTAVASTLDKEAALVAQYVQMADKIAGLRSNPSAAMGLIGGFLSGYQDLRNTMDATNDDLQARAKHTEDQANSIVGRSRLTILLFCVVSSALLLVIAFSIARQITRRLSGVVGNFQRFASGDLTQHVDDARSDELGEMARWFNQAMEKFRATISRVASSAAGVTTAVEKLNSASEQMSANSEETSSQARVVFSTTEHVTSTLQTVATATEQMNTSISEIAKNVTQAATVAGQAVEIAGATNQIVSKLGDSSSEIGAVVKVITSIAQQTNLLALNATIEAARAGEAGKGFSVVANEVKELAKQTAKATEDIGVKINAIQLNTRESVDAIGKITVIINQINDISRTISAAIEEQNATTSEITRNISEGARGSGEISSNISGVADAAHSTSQGARDVQKASAELHDMSANLKNLVGQFKYTGADSTGNGHSVPA